MAAKKYNLADRKAAIKARKEAVLFLLFQGYSFKAAGYAVGKTGEFARSVKAKSDHRIKNITVQIEDTFKI
jgi:hypothetical protein